MKKITDFTKDGKCSSCGQCCVDAIPLSEEEVHTIKAYIRKHGIKEQRHSLTRFDFTCPFRNEEKRTCEIYEVRPAICRAFKCNNTEDQIERDKIYFHSINKVVYMRSEFFGNNELKEFVFEVNKQNDNIYKNCYPHIYPDGLPYDEEEFGEEN